MWNLHVERPNKKCSKLIIKLLNKDLTKNLEEFQ